MDYEERQADRHYDDRHDDYSCDNCQSKQDLGPIDGKILCEPCGEAHHDARGYQEAYSYGENQS